LKLKHENRLVLKIDIEGSELEIWEKMLKVNVKKEGNDNDDPICLLELNEMDFIKRFLLLGQICFINMKHLKMIFLNFSKKCGHNINLKLLY
jgi:hypothetical protein